MVEDGGCLQQHVDCCSTERYPEYFVALDSVFVAVVFAAEVGPEAVVVLVLDTVAIDPGIAAACALDSVVAKDVLVATDVLVAKDVFVAKDTLVAKDVLVAADTGTRAVGTVVETAKQ